MQDVNNYYCRQCELHRHHLHDIVCETIQIQAVEKNRAYVCIVAAKQEKKIICRLKKQVHYTSAQAATWTNNIKLHQRVISHATYPREAGKLLLIAR